MNQRAMIMISDLGIWSMGEGKGAKSLAVTLKSYANRGWRIFFITGNRLPETAPDFHENITLIGFDLKFLKFLYSIRIVGFFAKVLWWVVFLFWSTLIALKILILDKQKIDLFYGYEILGVPAARFLSLIFRLPMVSRFQGTILFPLLDNPLGLARHWQHVLAYKIKSPLVIMTNDGTHGDRVLHRFHVDPERVLFLMNGVDRDLCNEVRVDFAVMEDLPVEISDQGIILTVSRLIRWKGVDRAISALAQVIKKGQDVILVIVGDGPERGNLEQLAQELGVAERVLFVGAVSRDQIGHYYRMGDIFLSLYDLSNVGNPLIEAMICGKPIIALNTGDTNQVIENGLNGLLIDPDALDDLPGMLIDLLMDPDLRDQLAENAQAYAVAHFKTWEERMQIEFSRVEQLIRGK